MIVQELRETFHSGLTKSLAYRKEQLKGLHNLVAENEQKIIRAAYDDLRKPPQEVILGETGMVKQECVDAIKNLDQWAAPKKVSAGLLSSMDTLHIRKEPLGVVLIIGAWNYPFNLLLDPAVGAIAAGNTVVLKPSEVSSNMAALITELLPKYLDSRSYQIINGSAGETTALLENKFDHIFYTGSGTVGKIIMGAAAKQLTPVTLELGGKSPAFVAKDANVDVVTRRLAIGKFFNCGQSCIAPDYLIVE
ncbi:Aldehyde dehydrogenase, partial [Modicella reniformis]